MVKAVKTNRSQRNQVIFLFLLSLLVAPTACGPGRAVETPASWRSNGPKGGETLGLVIDPATATTLYAGTFGGAVFSIQQAVTGQPITETLPTLPLDWLLALVCILSAALIGVAVGAFFFYLNLDQPSSSEWRIRILTAGWPIELIIASILVPSVAVVVIGNERDLVQLLGIAALVGAVAYVLGFIALKLSGRLVSFESIAGCGTIFAALELIIVFYYVLVATICRHIILPIMFRIAGISGARIPPVFGKQK